MRTLKSCLYLTPVYHLPVQLSQQINFFKKHLGDFPSLQRLVTHPSVVLTTLPRFHPNQNPRYYHSLLLYFSKLRDHNISPAQYVQYLDDLKLSPPESLNIDLESHCELASTYRDFIHLKKRTGFAIDYKDHTDFLLELFAAKPFLIKNRFQHIFIDELQDCSNYQFEFITKLAAICKFKSITATGDDDQAIFMFKGASSNIFKVPRDCRLISV